MGILPHGLLKWAAKGYLTCMEKEFRPEEHALLKEWRAATPIPHRATPYPIVVGMVGLVGDGKSTAAQGLARYLGAVVIEGDAIRTALRRRGMPLARARALAEAMASHTVARGGNAVMDSDFVDARKRAALVACVEPQGARVVWVRVLCDPDIAMGRIITRGAHKEFFTGAPSPWKGENVGAVVKMRERWRRTPLHYRWSKRAGGQFTPVNFLLCTSPCAPTRQVGGMHWKISCIL